MDKSQRTMWAECWPHRCVLGSVGEPISLPRPGPLQTLAVGTELTSPNAGQVDGGVGGRGGGSKWGSGQAGTRRGNG